MQYFNVKEGLHSKGRLMTLEELEKTDLDPNKDAYISVYAYNEKHKELADKTGSIAGIKDVTTDTLIWDFDSKNDPDKARFDVVALANRLIDRGVQENSIACYFSGNKGFHVALPIDRTITPDQFKKATAELAQGLPTFDPSVNDPARVIRLEHTKHHITGLYKIPLHIEEVDSMTVDQIKEWAKDGSFNFNKFSKIAVKLESSLYEVALPKKEVVKPKFEMFDPRSTPRGWKPYKWAIAQGHFESGERHNALMVLAATYRALGYDKEQTYYACKAAVHKQVKQHGGEKFDKVELWNNIIEQSVFSDRWEGGQYSPQTNPWLKSYCERNGFETEEREEPPFIDPNALQNVFTDYATNFDKNLIKSGIQELDNNLTLSTSTLNGLLGQPGSGKTTVALNMLRNTSIDGVQSIFLSLDMGAPLVYAKLVQREIGLGFRQSVNLFKTNPTKAKEINEKIKEEYKNVGFNFKSGLTVADIKELILKRGEQTGVKPKFLVIDYLECIAGPYNDATANAGHIANQLKDVANEMEICILLLLQTQKHSTPEISDPLTSMKQIKGSSVIEQACSTVLTIWREGYDPKYTADDKYMSMSVVKNRLGAQWQGDFSWEGVRGTINSLSEEQIDAFEEFKARKKQARAANQNDKRDRDWT